MCVMSRLQSVMTYWDESSLQAFQLRFSEAELDIKTIRREAFLPWLDQFYHLFKTLLAYEAPEWRLAAMARTLESTCHWMTKPNKSTKPYREETLTTVFACIALLRESLHEAADSWLERMCCPTLKALSLLPTGDNLTIHAVFNKQCFDDDLYAEDHDSSARSVASGSSVSVEMPLSDRLTQVIEAGEKHAHELEAVVDDLLGQRSDSGKSALMLTMRPDFEALWLSRALMQHDEQLEHRCDAKETVLASAFCFKRRDLQPLIIERKRAKGFEPLLQLYGAQTSDFSYALFVSADVVVSEALAVLATRAKTEQIHFVRVILRELTRRLSKVDALGPEAIDVFLSWIEKQGLLEHYPLNLKDLAHRAIHFKAMNVLGALLPILLVSEMDCVGLWHFVAEVGDLDVAHSVNRYFPFCDYPPESLLNSSGEYPHHIAAEKGHSKLLRYFCRRGFQDGQCNDWGESVFFLAALSKDLATVLIAIEHFGSASTQITMHGEGLDEIVDNLQEFANDEFLLTMLNQAFTDAISHKPKSAPALVRLYSEINHCSIEMALEVSFPVRRIKAHLAIFESAATSAFKYNQSWLFERLFDCNAKRLIALYPNENWWLLAVKSTDNVRVLYKLSEVCRSVFGIDEAIEHVRDKPRKVQQLRYLESFLTHQWPKPKASNSHVVSVHHMRRSEPSRELVPSHLIQTS